MIRIVSVPIFIICAIQIFGLEHDYKGFDDNIIFGINWPGSENQLENLILTSDTVNDKPILKNKEILKVVTSNKETYECHLPEIITNEAVNIGDYNGPSPLELLNPLFSQKICSYRLESYWSYEVCHGRYVRQYHEERDGKHLKTQQYFLGNWDAENQKKLEVELANLGNNKEKLKHTKLYGVSMPSIEMVMEDGSICDLTGKHRLTRVLYICYGQGKHEVLSFKETQTCEYEIIVLSPLLCTHPLFKPHDATENSINCIPVGGTAKKPQGLLALELDHLKNQHRSFHLTSDNDKDEAKDVLAVFKVEKIIKDGETHLKIELRPLEGAGDDDRVMGGGNNLLADKAVNPVISDDSPVRSFLNGDNCLTGGSGWWKYEFCYGKHVQQYHVERNGGRTSVLLGVFDEKAHRRWIAENTAKAPKPLGERTSISHFYSNGDICDKTGKPRQTEVKLKCIEKNNSAQVSLYLLEPKTCHYILGVESPLICEILPLADENALVPSSIFANHSTKEKDQKEKADVKVEGQNNELGNT